MPTISVTEPTDMQAYNLFGIQDSVITQESASQITAYDSADQETFIFSGSFSNFDPTTGIPTAGVVTGFVLQDGAQTAVTISDANLSVPDFLTFMSSNNIAGLNAELLAGNDSISGSPGADFLYGYGGNDTIAGGGGSDYIDGGAGSNTAVYSSPSTNFTLSSSGGTWTVVDSTGAEGTDTLVNIQHLQFSDRTVDLTMSDAATNGYALAILRTGATLDSSVLVANGLELRTDALNGIIKQAAASSTVAILAYEFFTGSAPSAAGMDYLVSPTGPNPDNLNSAYYQGFNTTNRYINFASNLGRGGAGSAQFATDYGSLTPEQAMTKAYQTIFGGTPSADKVNHLLYDLVPDGNGGTETRLAYFETYGQDGPSGVGTKAAMVGWLMAEAVAADLGTYAKSNDAFLTDVALHNAAFGVDIIGHYAQPSYVYNPG